MQVPSSSASPSQPLPPRRLHWVQAPTGLSLASLPAWAAGLGLPADGPRLVTGLRHPQGEPLLWMDSAQARGWVSLGADTAAPLSDTAPLQAAFSAFSARGFVDADSALLALGRCMGRLPLLSWGEAANFPVWGAALRPAPRALDLYAIVDSAERLDAVLQAGLRTVQVRIKRPPQPHPGWDAQLQSQLERSLALARSAGAELFINDHAEAALALGATGLHLGQEDLLALGDPGREALCKRIAQGLALGISSHSVWELCRARSLPARYIACGPVWATVTKDMPWVPQGLDNLGWWRRHAGAPVVAIGGILTPDHVAQVAPSGVDGVCLVRGLGENPRETVPAFEAALARGRQAAPANPEAHRAAAWDEDLHPSLPARQ